MERSTFTVDRRGRKVDIRMRGSQAIISFAAAAAIFALGLAGCKYSASAPPFPNPSGAPTFPPGTVTEAPIPTAGATPIGIAAGPDGNMWFVESAGNKVARVVPATMSITEFPIPTAGSRPIDVTRGPNGNPNMWFDEFAGNRIASIVPSTGVISEFTIPTASSGPTGLTADPTGDLWFGEFNASQIASITTAGFITEYPIPYGPNAPRPDAVVIAPDHTVWFLDPANNVVVHMTFPGPNFQEFALLTAANNPQFIANGSDGNLWFTELGDPNFTGCRIGRVNLGGSPSISEFSLPNSQPFPLGDWCNGIALGSDGNMWFAETGVGSIGRIKVGGAVTEYGIPGSGTTAVGMANGPDANMWFTDGNLGLNYAIGTNQVGKVNIGALPATSIRKEFQAKVTTRPLKAIPEHGAFPHKK
jgi:streptogramin lyase